MGRSTARCVSPSIHYSTNVRIWGSLSHRISKRCAPAAPREPGAQPGQTDLDSDGERSHPERSTELTPKARRRRLSERASISSACFVSWGRHARLVVACPMVRKWQGPIKVSLCNPQEEWGTATSRTGSPPARRRPGVRFAHASTASRRAVARRELDFDGAPRTGAEALTVREKAVGMAGAQN